MSGRKIRVAVISGGASSEAQVSKMSATAVIRALGDRSYAVEELELDSEITAGLTRFRPDVVFPAVHGAGGEDGALQGFLETLGLPYVGSGVSACALAMDKGISRLVFESAGIDVARGLVVAAGDAFEPPEWLASVRRVVVKPVDQGSALGVNFCAPDEIPSLLNRLSERYPRLLVEEFVEGREITVGVLDLDAPLAFPAIEITTPADSWYDFEHRYTPGLSEHLIPARIAPEAEARARERALAAHRALGCRDLSRTDMIATDSGRVVVLEVNAIPGMTPTSLYPDGAAAVGVDFPELVDRLVLAALARA